MIVGGDECGASEDEELDRRLHPLLRREEMSEKGRKRKKISFRFDFFIG
jgi:hypothetical protein